MIHSYSRLTQKLSRRFLFIYTILFVFLSVIILIGSVCLLFFQTRQTAENQLSLAAESITSYQKELRDKTYLLTASHELTEMIKNYQQYSTDENYEKVNLYLSNFQTGDSMLRFISIRSIDNTVFHSLNSSSTHIQEYLEKQPHYQNLSIHNSSYFSPILKEGFENETPYCYFLSCQPLNGQTFLIAVCYDAQSLVNSLTTAGDTLSNITVYNNQREELFSFPHSSFNKFPIYLEDSSSSVGYHIDKTGLHFYLSGYATSTYLIETVFFSVLLKNYFFLFLCLLILYFIPLAAALLYLIPVNEKMLHPIAMLAEQIHTFSLGDNAVNILHTDDEIEDLSLSFHKMTVNINQQAETLARQERNEAITYYKLLATQTDPHFIYNTMNIINILARQGNFNEIIQVNTALTRVLRERLNTQNIVFEKIDKEIAALKQYQTIMDYRYHHQVTFEYDIDPSVLQLVIPKNILQPLAENSYYHGLTREDGSISGTIGLVIYEMNNEVIIELSDDGSGISPETLSEIKVSLQSPSQIVSEETTAHIGLENIYRRVQYLYHDNFSMDIQSTPGYGTTVSLSLPSIPPDSTSEKKR